MSDYPQSLRVSLTPEQTAQLLTWARRGTLAEVDAECEPGGYVIQIEIGGFANCATAVRGHERLDLGDVDIDFIDVR